MVVTGSGELKRSTIDQISDVIRLYLKMSAGEPSEPIGMAQLIRAIIGDEPVKMRKLAGNLGIDSGKIRNMIIFREAHIGLPSGDMMFREIRDLLSKYCHDYVVDIYSGDIVVFLDDGLSSQWLPALRMLRDKMAEKGMTPVCVYARNLADTSEVREAYLNVSAHLEDARNLYRNSSIISYNEILYVAECKEIISRGEDAIKKELEPLKHLNLGDNEPEQDLTETLSSFYFDSGMSVTETAANLYIHVNTVKYRLRQISEVIGCRVTEMPEMLGLYRALAIKRLIQS